MDFFAFLEKGLGLTPGQQKLLIRTLWVIFMTLQTLYLFGFLVYLGFAAPFAKASDVDKLLAAAEKSASISMQQELRTQTRIWCSAVDDDVRSLAQRRIDELRTDLFTIAKLRTPEPMCSRAQTTQ